MSRKAFRRTLAAVASVAAVLALPSAASAGLVTEFSTGLTLTNAPTDITAGPGGNLWFTEQGLLPGVGRITPGGAITEYPVSLLTVPGDITAGQDGGVWFTERGLTDAIARIDPATGNITEHPLPNGTGVTGLTTGDDGDLWFAEADRGKVGRMTPAGDLTEYDLGLSGDETLKDLTNGPDGWIWFTIEHDGGAPFARTESLHKIGRINPADGDICFFSAGLTGAPNKIVAASDGKLYFTESGNPAAIGRVKTDGAIREYRSGLTAGSQPTSITEGGDGALWFTTAASPGGIARMTLKKNIFSEFPAGLPGLGLTPDSGPAGITRGPDGNVWFTESALDGRIARMLVGPDARLELTQRQDLIGRHVVTDGELKATIVANSQATTYHVVYGPDSSFGEQSEEFTVPASAGDQPVTDVIELSLEPGSHYRAQIVATNESGEVLSPEIELWTDENGKLRDFAPELPQVVPTPTATPTPTPTAKPATTDPVVGTTPPTGDAAIAPPVLGEAVVVRPLSGKVKVKAPGARGYTALAAGANLPVGTKVDARAGKIVLQSARDKHGRTQNGTFWGGVFQIRQGKQSRGMTDLVLRGGGFGRCGARAGVSVLAHESGGKGKRRVVRRLWGKDKHSRFRTHGRDSVATVRGTKWVTTDRCDGTLTKVTEGKVLVRDLRRKRSVMVRAGHAYLARHRR